MRDAATLGAQAWSGTQLLQALKAPGYAGRYAMARATWEVAIPSWESI